MQLHITVYFMCTWKISEFNLKESEPWKMMQEECNNFQKQYFLLKHYIIKRMPLKQLVSKYTYKI